MEDYGEWMKWKSFWTETSMARNKKTRKRYQPKAGITPKRLEHIASTIRNEFFRAETLALMNLHKGEVPIEDLSAIRDHLYSAEFILIHRVEEFADVPVYDWCHDIGQATQAMTNAIDRAREHHHNKVTLTGDELKVVTDIVAQVYPFLHDELEKSPRTTAIEMLACLRFLKDAVGGFNGLELTTEITPKLFERYYQHSVKAIRMNTPLL